MPPLAKLRRDFPFPTSRPKGKPDFGESWLKRGNAQLLKAFLSPELSDAKPRDVQQPVVLEFGVWKGRSSDHILRINRKCTLICVDWWQGDKSIWRDGNVKQKPDDVFAAFVRNVWVHRHRVIPVWMEGRKAMRELRRRNIRPDLIYLDMGHLYEDVKGDLNVLYDCFPNVPILGDDFDLQNGHEGVSRAVKEIVHERKVHRLVHNQNCYALVPAAYDDLYDQKELRVRPVRATDVALQPVGGYTGVRRVAVVMAVPYGAAGDAQCKACKQRLREVYAAGNTGTTFDVSFFVERNQPTEPFNRGKLLNTGFLRAHGTTPQQPHSRHSRRSRKPSRATKKSPASAQQLQSTSPPLHPPDTVLFQDHTLPPDDTLATYYRGYPRQPVQLCYNRPAYTFHKWYFGSLLITPTAFQRINGYPNDVVGWDGADLFLQLRFKDTQTEIFVPRTGNVRETAQSTPVHSVAEWSRIKSPHKKQVNAHSATWRRNGLAELVG